MLPQPHLPPLHLQCGAVPQATTTAGGTWSALRVSLQLPLLFGAFKERYFFSREPTTFLYADIRSPLGWQAEELQPFYCAGTGDCDQIRSNLWDSTYYCTRNGIVQWVQYCGPSSCSGADQLCENQNVSDIYSPSGQLWYPTSAAPSPPKGFASPPYPFFQSGSTRSTPPRVSTYGDIESNFQVW